MSAPPPEIVIERPVDGVAVLRIDRPDVLNALSMAVRATLAERIAALPPLAVDAIKEVVLIGPDAPLPTALALERKAFQLLFGTADRDEGIAAFRDKRKPLFQGR